MDFSIIGIKYNKWSKTNWKGKILPVEICRPQIPRYENRYGVKVFNKLLGILPKNQKILPFGCKVFASLNNCGNYVKAHIVDQPIDWRIPFSDVSDNYLPKIFLVV